MMNSEAESSNQPNPSHPGSEQSAAKSSRKPAPNSVFGRLRNSYNWAFQAPPPPPKVEAPRNTSIGRADEPLRALAFGGGGFDSGIQLGVAHALLVANAHPPDAVVGISAGAINAVALAEILQAGSTLPAGQQAAARVAKFREILEAYREMPAELMAGLLPDPYEVTARAPLKAQELPIHFEEERAERNRAVNARFGLIRLLNGLLEIRLQLRTITMITRLILELRRLEESQRPFRRVGLKFYEMTRLWLLIGSKLLLIVRPVTRILVGILLAKPYQALLARIEKHRQLMSLSRFWRTVERLKTWTLKVLLQVVGYYTDRTAKSIILQSRLVRGTWYGLIWLLGLGFTAFAWLVLLPVIGLAWLVKSEAHRNQPDRATTGGKSWLNRFLASYDLQKDLATPFLLKPLFVRLFDPYYYGQFNLGDVVNEALREEESRGIASPAECDRKPKLLSTYYQRQPPIYVAPVAADVSRGHIEPLPAEVSVVDGLLAATAAVPLFRAQTVKDKLYIDGLNVANEATYALFELLLSVHQGRGREVQFAAGTRGLEVYPVSPFSLSGDKLDATNGPAGANQNGTAKAADSGLVHTALRAMRLKRFQDANLERRMVQLYRRSLPAGTNFVNVGDRAFARGTMHPIETDRMLNINERVLGATTREERRRIADEAVAEGCRATLQVILANQILATARARTNQGATPMIIPCRTVIEARLGLADLPGSSSNPADGPGVSEICRQCAVYKNLSQPMRQSLVVQSLAEPKEDWAVRDQPTRPLPRPPVTTETPPPPTLEPAEGWPRDQADLPGKERPTVTLLFSGGVFRGVFQIGVANALNEVGLKPDLVAGSSVGSITGALIAEVFRTSPAARPAKICELASIFLGIDRLVLTDRFSDFIRRFTLRAAEARFSLRDADRFFRRYDQEGFDEFNERSRRVVAGIERLFYLNPFGLKELTRALRNRDTPEANRLLRRHLQTFLDRSGVGQEILGAEPLLLLIRKFILSAHPNVDADSAEFNLFQPEGIHLLATTTNLKRGELKILSSRPRTSAKERVVLKEGLLASSAFPAVFRPRWAWEVFAEANDDQFVDGGVMDNLPLDAVTQFLNRAARNQWIQKRPQVKGQAVPHLVFTASLEVRRRGLTSEQLRNFAEDWPSLSKRAKQLGYNQKIDKFAEAQRDFRTIFNWRRENEPGFDPARWPLLDLETVVVKPEWLPGTFAFNSMLGFRRVNQAASIAHGCASTLVELHRRALAHPHWAAAWGLQDEVNPRCVGPDDHVPLPHGPGRCWFRKDRPCPFSPDALPPELPAFTRNELAAIYEQCGEIATHRPSK